MSTTRLARRLLYTAQLRARTADHGHLASHHLAPPRGVDAPIGRISRMTTHAMAVLITLPTDDGGGRCAAGGFAIHAFAERHEERRFEAASSERI